MKFILKAEYWTTVVQERHQVGETAGCLGVVTCQQLELTKQPEDSLSFFYLPSSVHSGEPSASLHRLGLSSLWWFCQSWHFGCGVIRGEIQELCNSLFPLFQQKYNLGIWAGKFRITNAAVRHSQCNRANYRRTVAMVHEDLTLSGAANLFWKSGSPVLPLQKPGIQTREARSLCGTLTSDQSLSSKSHVSLENLKTIGAWSQAK